MKDIENRFWKNELMYCFVLFVCLGFFACGKEIYIIIRQEAARMNNELFRRQKFDWNQYFEFPQMTRLSTIFFSIVASRRRKNSAFFFQWKLEETKQWKWKD